MIRSTTARPYWNPYLAGALLGLTLLATFVVAGQGLGATAFPKRLIAVGAGAVAPEWNAVFLGGFIGAVSAGRFQSTIEKGPRISNRGRMKYAFWGGTIMGFAAALARGCTSGQALSGGATLATGSWLFMLMVFGGGYSAAYLVRRQWI